jgi:hypothetical protein
MARLASIQGPVASLATVLARLSPANPWPAVRCWRLSVQFDAGNDRCRALLEEG